METSPRSSVGPSPRATTHRRTPVPQSAQSQGHLIVPAVIGAMSTEVPSSKDESSLKPPEERRVAPPALRRRAKKAFRASCRFLGLGFMSAMFLASVFDWPGNLFDDRPSRRRVMSGLFLTTLIIVALEDVLMVNKSAVVLCLAATMWSVLAVSLHEIHPMTGEKILHEDLNDGLQEVGSVILFLLPAMGVVESIDHFSGFEIVTSAIRSYVSRRRSSLLPISCVVSFALSSVIDNLTSTIVMLKILRHLVQDTEQRHSCGAVVVLAANAGGAWSPIGDVTTTMLWIQKKITVGKMVVSLFPSCVVAGLVPLLGMMFQVRGSLRDVEFRAIEKKAEWAEGQEQMSLADSPQIGGGLPLDGDFADFTETEPTMREQLSPLILGTGVIVMVPLLKMATGLPPYLGMLLALGVFWLVTDLLDCAPRKLHLWELGSQAESVKSEGAPQDGVVGALKGLDLTGLLFFIGILLSISALNSSGVLVTYSEYMVSELPDSPVLLSVVLGISSSIVDNVPLVQAAIDMFDDETDSQLWHLIALTAGTGGSILSIGSIAGVTLMSMEGVGFAWYVRKVSFWALAGFFAGVGTFSLQHTLTESLQSGE